jgi:hypothetical protein
MAEGRPKGSAERKGKAGPSEARRGKYSPPAIPERVTSEAWKRRDRKVRGGTPVHFVLTFSELSL